MKQGKVIEFCQENTLLIANTLFQQHKRRLYTWTSPDGQHTQLCATLCDPMDCSTPGLPVHHQLLEFTQTHPSSPWFHPAISSSVIPFFSCFQSFPATESFPVSQFLASSGQIIGVSASASVLPMNTQDWSPLGWTRWISLQSKGLSRVFSNTTVQSIYSSVVSFLYSPTLTSIHDYWKNHCFD